MNGLVKNAFRILMNKCLFVISRVIEEHSKTNASMIIMNGADKLLLGFFMFEN